MPVIPGRSPDREPIGEVDGNPGRSIGDAPITTLPEWGRWNALGKPGPGRLARMKASASQAWRIIPSSEPSPKAVMPPLLMVLEPTVTPPIRPLIPGVRGESKREATPSTTCSASPRPKRASQAFGMGSLLRIVPMPTPSSIRAPAALLSSSSMVSLPSS